MSSRSRAIALGVALLVTVPACGSSDDAAEAPAASTTEATTTTAAATVPFESTRYPYRVVMPADWQLSEVDGTWTSLDQFSAGEEVPGEEVLGTADRATFLVVNSMALPDGTTPEAWTDAFGALVAEGLFDGCTRTTGDGTVAGEPADVVEDTCGDDLIVGRSLVHGGRGWYFTTRGIDEATTAVLDDLVASIEFTDD
jgi:hypothetical protein